MKDITLEELVESFQKAKANIDEMEAEKTVMQEAILDMLKKMKITGCKTKNGYLVTKVVTNSLTGVSLSTAKQLGATVMKEEKDLEKLKTLAGKGVKVTGARIIQYVKVTEAK